MSYKYINKIQTKYNPSVIEYSSCYDLFICGTYQLFDDKKCQTIDETLSEVLKRVNNRFGNLLLITKTNQLIEEYECFDGGVFDLKLIQFNDINDSLIVAHSNGFVTIYGINCNKLITIKRFATNSSLLTSLTPIDNQYIIVGNSDGKIISINLFDEKTVQLSVTKFCEPIWTLFCHQIKDKYLLFVGSDDSIWRIFCLNGLKEDFSQLQSAYCNNDSNAGITCFASNESSNNVLSLIVGSYDELIRFYTIEFNVNENKPNVYLKHKLHIPESGIWRIVLRQGIDRTFLVSGMYSGAHIVVDSKVAQTLDPLNAKSDEKELIYGLSCDSMIDNILMASFYAQVVYLFTKS